MSESGARIANGEILTLCTVTVFEVGIYSTLYPWGFYAIKEQVIKWVIWAQI